MTAHRKPHVWIMFHMLLDNVRWVVCKFGTFSYTDELYSLKMGFDEVHGSTYLFRRDVSILVLHIMIRMH